jgi:glycosyltransferase involved in cell wall biosynthesis
MSAQRRVAVGATLFNKAAYFEDAVESLLAQTYRDFTLVLLDDASTDETPAIARRFADADDRVVFVRNEERVGMLENWRRAYYLAKEATPGLEYFAWGSDHDVWEPRFLERLVAELDSDPSIVLAYPRSTRIDDHGAVIREHRTTLDTVGIRSPLRRVFLASSQMVAGNIVYGLIRAEALEHAAVFRDVMYPDRLLVPELAVAGGFRFVPEQLWQRRFEWRDDRASRQRRAFWPGVAPWHAWLPAWVTHAVVLLRAHGPRAAGWYVAGFSVRIAELRRKRLRKRIVRRKRRLRAAAGRAARAVGIRRRRTT